MSSVCRGSTHLLVNDFCDSSDQSFLPFSQNERFCRAHHLLRIALCLHEILKPPSTLGAPLTLLFAICRNCLYIPAAFSKAQKEYDIVVSDADDLNAVLNITTVQLIYLDYTNASIASSLVS